MSVDEIKLYRESENDDALDASFNEDSFSELEAVMTKVHKGYEISNSFAFYTYFLQFSFCLFSMCFEPNSKESD